ncbi:hypothetical protein [Iningainema tapete]|uniref:Uncharacterized protein n=1 Tax=Iningainema tapete BLCC-T55 TaxID=2748662 RepID=A0A8J6XGE9_9CYAN|nr:hypothetical protein [Iningainema tapete]MBD2771259.1 hypothetical protein [Iningainema tapete BLCC-T55]
MHGKFTFELQRYKYQGNNVNYFELTNQFSSGYISNRLQEFTAYYSNRLSYTEVENLIIRTTGDKLLTERQSPTEGNPDTALPPKPVVK